VSALHVIVVFANATTTATASGSGVDPVSFILGIIAGGLVSGISLFVGQILIDWWNRPILEVDKAISPIPAEVRMKSGLRGKVDDVYLDDLPYIVSRICVTNKGKTAAENCKAALDSESHHLRICWHIPKERSTMTINSRDSEYVDVCAVLAKDPSRLIGGDQTNVYTDEQQPRKAFLTSKEIPRRISPTEEGWQEPIRDNRNLDSIGQSDLKFKLTITAKNAFPYVCDIIILEKQDGEGRIVSFLE